MPSSLAIATVILTAFVAGCAPADIDTTSVKTPTSPSAAGEAVSSPEPPSLPAPDNGGCVASRAQWAVGQRATDDLLEKARVAAEARVARFVRHDEAITTEFMFGRLTLFLDNRRDVQTVICG